jgi:hypothetical protein
VRLEQRVAIALAVGVLPRVRSFGYRQPCARCQCPDGFRKAHLVKKLNELDDVPARSAAETVEKALVAVDVERWRLLPVKRAQALPRRPAPPQRNALLHDLNDIGVRLEIVDETRGEERHQFSITALTTTLSTPRP